LSNNQAKKPYFHLIQKQTKQPFRNAKVQKKALISNYRDYLLRFSGLVFIFAVEYKNKNGL